MDQPLVIPAGRDVRLADFDPDFHEGLDRDEAEAETRRHCEKLDELAYRLFAEAKRAIVVVLQGIDTSGKDGTIRMLAGGISPQCLDVKSFKAPSQLELSHDFLWRVHAAVPAHGRIGIFNRSHYGTWSSSASASSFPRRCGRPATTRSTPSRSCSPTAASRW